MIRRLVDFTGYELLGIITTVLFFVAFVAILVRVIFLRPSYTEHAEQLPLQDGTQNPESHDAEKE
jgi:hypothetical protein